MGSCFSKEKGSSDATDDAAAAVGSSGRWRKSRDAIFLKKKPSIDDDADQLLHHISGRMVNNAASKTASVYTQQGKKGTNQDAMIVWEVSFIFYLQLIILFIFNAGSFLLPSNLKVMLIIW